ncbi:MAG: hypothetical protein KDC03_20940, partial [Flavobacteriales bacterium]|nr:hypothetical protein [Flavobacteriales bacterium]
NLDGGKVHKLVRVQHGVPEPSQQLSQLGVFTDLATLETALGIIPYTVNSPLWSDRALKRRWIALPNDGVFDSPSERVGFDPDDHWTFPAGTVLIKHFELPLNENDPAQVARLETRFLIYTAPGQAYGLTYRWNANGTEAYLIDDAEVGDWTVSRADGTTFLQTWTFPSRQQCMSCHTSNAGHVLGLKTHQLNGDMFYPGTGITANQLESWDHLDMFDQPLPPVDQLRRAYPLDDLTASAEERVMAYLDANCAQCHRPNGVQGAFDARFATPLDQKGLINEPTIGMNSPMGQLVVTPGDTLGSELWVRDSRPNGTVGSMPPLGKALVHQAYMDVLTEWIMTVDASTLAQDHTALYIKVFLQGPYGNGDMVDSLRAGGLVPLEDPYSGLGMHVAPGGDKTAYPHTLADGPERRVIDWLLVELRDPLDDTYALETHGALLLNDGTVIDPQGGPLRIGTVSGSYYVAVRHRNHLGVMTAQPLVFGGAPVVLDLSDQATPLFGFEPTVHLGGGVMALWAGDANRDGVLKYTGSDNDR